MIIAVAPKLVAKISMGNKEILQVNHEVRIKNSHEKILQNFQNIFICDLFVQILTTDSGR